ncbi:MAG: tetratricopeptide repeat protein [Candidatus Eisenbacteria bacterium]|uniref:Tetratricopeptide repeat protein n=1 Tax=Eiseniibacteriota bacterium TaxID=2212470 RepID=A0A956M181_UNCEI|nr:tetratricopeptide repeat protein [Candidatus Eisenbacteria bacterium]
MKRTLRIAALGLAAVLAFAACSNPHLAGGKLHFDQKRFEKAEENFQLAVDKDPKNGEAYMWLAMAQAELDKPEEAAANFDKAAELTPRIAQDVVDNRDHYYADRYNSGQTYDKNAKGLKEDGDEAGAEKEFRNALRDFKKAVIYKSDSPQAWMNIGATYFNLGKIDSALTVFDQVHSMAPDDDDLNVVLHEVYKSQGNQAFNQALEAKSTDKEGAKKLFEGALSFYSQAAGLDPNDLDLTQNRAAVAWELSDLDDTRKDELRASAASDYEHVLASEPKNTDVLQNLSMLESGRGNNEAALDYATRLVDVDPKQGMFHIIQGRAQGALNNKNAMLGDLLVGQALESGMDVPPSQARAQADAGGPKSDILRQYREAGEPEQIRIYKDSGGSQYTIWFYWTRGRAYCYQEDGKELYAKKFEKVEEAEPMTEEGGSEGPGGN